jgi:hypothetical protein
MTRHDDADIFRVLRRLAVNHAEKVKEWWFLEEFQDKVAKESTTRAFPWRN